MKKSPRCERAVTRHRQRRRPWSPAEVSFARPFLCSPAICQLQPSYPPWMERANRRVENSFQILWSGAFLLLVKLFGNYYTPGKRDYWFYPPKGSFFTARGALDRRSRPRGMLVEFDPFRPVLSNRPAHAAAF